VIGLLLAAAAAVFAAPSDPPATPPLESESIAEGIRPFELTADWSERAGAIALASRAPAEDEALLAELGIDAAALASPALTAEIRARALDLAWRVVEHPECTPILRRRAEERIRALLPLVPPNRDPDRAATFRALLVVARSTEWADPASGGATVSRARFGDDEIARLRRDVTSTAGRVFEWSRGALRLDVTVRVAEGEPFRSFARAASREYDREGVLPDLDAEAARRAFLDPVAAAREGYHGVFLCVKYEGTVAGPPIPSPCDGFGGATRVATGGDAASPGGFRHVGYGTLHYRSRAASWFGRTGFLHEWYHGLRDLASLASSAGDLLPDNHSVLLHSRIGREERLVSDDDPEFYRIVLSEIVPPRLLRAVAGAR
jgi:hypothetical protein